MASAKQIAWRKKFALKYGKKKKGAKSTKSKSTPVRKSTGNKTDMRLMKLKAKKVKNNAS